MLNILFFILGFLCCAEYYARIAVPAIMVRELLGDNGLLHKEMGRSEGYKDGVIDAVKKLYGRDEVAVGEE